MASLHLRLGLHLQGQSFAFSDYPAEVNGPLFTRWLPDGRSDAIELSLGHPGWTLKLWFERCGFIEDNVIQFELNRREIDSTLMTRQAKLDAGPLRGILVVETVTEAELAAVMADSKGHVEYIGLGKRLIRAVHPCIKRLLEILRVTYGQYWIRTWEDWDSRDESLGEYFHRFNMKWSLTGEEPWSDFQPTELGPLTFVSKGVDYGQYLTHDDWGKIANLLREKFSPSLAARLLAETHHSMDVGEWKFAFVQGVSALETAMEAVFESQIQRLPEEVAKAFPAFTEMNNPTRLSIIAAIVPDLNREDLAGTLKAIKTRNDAVHAGGEPPESARSDLKGLVRIVSKLLPGPQQKFPKLTSGNTVYAPGK